MEHATGYQKAVRARNALLSQPEMPSHDLLAAHEGTVARLGSLVMRARNACIERLSPRFIKAFGELNLGHGSVELTQSAPEDEAEFCQALQDGRPRDRRAGRQGDCGPQP